MASALKEFHWNESEPDRERRNEQAAANLKEMHRDQKMISIHPFLSGWLRVELEKVKNYRDPTELLKEALLAEKFTNLDGETEFFYYTGAGEKPIAATKDLLETWLDDDICGLNNLMEFSWITQSALANWLRTDLNIEPPTSWALIDVKRWSTKSKKGPGAPTKLDPLPIFEEHLSTGEVKPKVGAEASAIQKELREIAKQKFLKQEDVVPSKGTIENKIRKQFDEYLEKK